MVLTQPMLQQLNLLMETTKVILYGASGHCKVIIDLCINSNIIIDKIVDDNPKSDQIFGIHVVQTNQFQFQKTDKLILSIGNNKIRKLLANKLEVLYSKAIHPNASVSVFSKINEGTVVMAGAVVNPDTIIGKHCIINSGAVVEHDCSIGDYAHISPNASLAGGVTVGEGSQVGIGASVIQGVKIGNWVTIGAGAVIIKDVPDYSIVVGNPGRIIKINNQDE